jgi:hypothetical protein
VLALAPYFNPHVIESIGDNYEQWREICEQAFGKTVRCRRAARAASMCR